MANPGTPAFSMPPAEDETVRAQADVERRQREDAAARTLEAATIGSGGLTVKGGFIDLKEGSSLHVSGEAVFDGDVSLPAGSLNTPGGSIGAGQDITAGQDVIAVRDVKAGRHADVDQNLTVGGNATVTGDVTTQARVRAAGDIETTGTVGLLRSVGSRNYIVGTNYAGAWINVDGTIGISPSSRLFKGAIRDWSFDPQKLLQVQAKSFVYKQSPVPYQAERQVGFIAEDLDELGLSAFLFYDDTGAVQGINYDRLTVALFVLAQWQEQRLSAIEQRLSAAGI
ncbi:hypothetical protein ACFJGV_15200 [Cnuibacter sp. UC19_7]|uniref:tail fiber domain-containing protein n=1 Tax=Cnuibacter sp. UC19_7 TaxID=3350166 RepID=UPI0036712470